MKTIVHFGMRPVTLILREFENEIDVDELTAINHSNLYGEAVTIPALMNHVGILKADVEHDIAMKEMDLDVFVAELKQTWRRTAAETAQKITEDGLKEKVLTDPGYKVKKKNLINAQHNLSIVDSVYWAVQSKDKKLNNLIKAVTPEELYEELQDGVVNNIVIKKSKSIVG